MNGPKLLNVFENHSIVLAHSLYSFWERAIGRMKWAIDGEK
jgi:hypothetical protein